MEKTVMIRYIERFEREDGTKARVGTTAIVDAGDARKLVDDGKAVIADIGPSETKPAEPAKETKAPRKQTTK